MTGPAPAPINARHPHNVRMVSGKVTQVMTAAEAEYYCESRDAYLRQTKFTENTDLKDLDRLLVHELMVFRWQQHLFAGSDYDGDMVNEKQLTSDIKLFCVDEATEILTQQGWKTYDQVVPGEPVYTLNTQTGLAEWQVPTTMHFGLGHKMHHRQTRQHSSLSTPGHEWPVWDARGNTRWVASENLNCGHWLMLATNPAVRDESERDAFVRLAGWYVTEGTVHFVRNKPAQGAITQSWRVNPRKVEVIRGLLSELYGAPGPLGSVRGQRQPPYWREHAASGDMMVFSLSVQILDDLQRVCAGPAWNLRPEWVGTLSGRQAQLLVESMVLGDGWVTSKGSVRFCNTQECTIRAFEMACALAGVPTTTRRRGIGDWEVGLLSARRCRVVLPPSKRGASIDELVDYEGIFWCPTTPNGTWLARRNGTVYFTGNSDQINKIKETMGLSKKAREEAQSDGNFSAWLSDLKARAKLFGVHRETQLTKALVLMKELFTVVNTFDRSDEEERRKSGFENEAEIVQWIRSVMQVEFDEIDTYFREHDQRYWIRSM